MRDIDLKTICDNAENIPEVMTMPSGACFSFISANIDANENVFVIVPIEEMESNQAIGNLISRNNTKTVIVGDNWLGENSNARFYKLPDFKITIVLIGNKVFLTNNDEARTIIIEDKMFAVSFKAIFDLLWADGT